MIKENMTTIRRRLWELEQEQERERAYTEEKDKQSRCETYYSKQGEALHQSFGVVR